MRSYRFAPSRALQAVNAAAPYQRIEASKSLSAEGAFVDLMVKPSREIEVHYHTPEEEIA